MASSRARCRQAAPPRPPPQLSTRVANGTRYKLSYPNDYDAPPPIPLLLSFHGWGGHPLRRRPPRPRPSARLRRRVARGRRRRERHLLRPPTATPRGTARARAPPAPASTRERKPYCSPVPARRAPTRARGRRATTRWPPRWRCSPTSMRRSASTRGASTPPASPTAECSSTRWRRTRGRPPDLRRTRRWSARRTPTFKRPPLYRAPFGVWGRLDHTIPPLQNPDAAGHPGDPTAALDAQWSGGAGCGARRATRRPRGASERLCTGGGRGAAAGSISMRRRSASRGRAAMRRR